MRTIVTVVVGILIGALFVAGGLALRAPQAQAQESGAGAAGYPALTIMPAEAGGVWLCWDPVEGAQYVVLRAESVEGPYEPVSGALDVPEFLDEEAPAGGAFYRVEILIEEVAGRDRDALLGDPEEVYREILALMEQGRYQEAVDLAAAFLAGYADRDMARQKIHYAYARALVGLGEFAEAKAALEELLSDYADAQLDASREEVMVDDARYLWGWIELQKGDPIRAHEELMSLADEVPGSNRAAKALMLANQALISRMNTRDALSSGRLEDTARDDRKAEILANIHRVQDDYPDSAVLPRMLQDYMVYLIWRPTPENRRELVRTANEIIERYPGTPYADYALEELTDTKVVWGDAEARLEAEQTISRRIEECLADGDQARATNWSYYKCKLFQFERRYPEVHALVDEVLDRDPKCPIKNEFLVQKASAYASQGLYESARDIYRQVASDLGSRRDEISLALALEASTYVDQGKEGEASAILESIASRFADLEIGKRSEWKLRKERSRARRLGR